MQIAISYWHQRKCEETLVWAQRALDVEPTHLLAGEFVAGVYWQLGDIERFVAENLRRARIFGVPDDAFAPLQQATHRMREVYAATGLAGLRRFVADQISQEPVGNGAPAKMAIRRAVVYGAAGRADEAFASLDQALAFRDPALVHLAVAPQWDSLRSDSRFRQRLKTMALPQSA